MLKLETGRRANNGDDNLVPLINIVFLMLIFFMVAGQISKSDAIKVEPPASISQQPLTETEPLDIIASAEGEIYIEDRALRLDQLQGDLQQRLAAVEDPDQLKVRVKTDAALPVSELKNLLREIRAAGLVRVSLVTRLVETPQQLSVASPEGGAS